MSDYSASGKVSQSGPLELHTQEAERGRSWGGCPAPHPRGLSGPLPQQQTWDRCPRCSHVHVFQSREILSEPVSFVVIKYFPEIQQFLLFKPNEVSAMFGIRVKRRRVLPSCSSVISILFLYGVFAGQDVCSKA